MNFGGLVKVNRWQGAILGTILGFLFIWRATPVGISEENKNGEELREATFAGGCFWCMQPPFDKTPGVKKTVVGYAGGHVDNPSYEQVVAGKTGHAESVRVIYDPRVVTYEQLLDVFWRSIDPTQKDGQFADRGSQYRTAIFFHDEEQRRLAEMSKAKLEQSKKFSSPIVTEISPAGDFYEAELYHQDYYKKNSVHYKLYKLGSGRAGYLKKTWGVND